MRLELIVFHEATPQSMNGIEKIWWDQKTGVNYTGIRLAGSEMPV